MSATLARVGIGLCGDLGGPSGLDLGAVARRLEESVQDVQVEIVPGLCHGPEQVPEIESRTGAERLVLGLCSRDSATHEFQSWARKAGLDPFALELVDLHAAGSVAVPLLAAAVARLRAFAGSEPEQLKLELISIGHKLSRRSLFTLPPSIYRAVASIAPASCVGERRCGLCLSACPVGAIEAGDGAAVVDKTACESCGMCVTTCPAGAIGLPGASLPQYEAEIAALLAAEPAGLVFACRQNASMLRAARNGGAPLDRRWLPVEVPCLGMVTPGWILQALAGGAPAVALLACDEACRFRQASGVRERVDYAQALLGLLGEDSPSERVRILRAEAEQLAQGLDGPRSPRRARPDGGRTRTLTLREPAATAGAALELAASYGAAGELSLVHRGSPTGLLRLREETCTACGVCADACPTGALVAEEGAEGATISYDASLCVSCRRCVSACPESTYDTLSVRAGTDLAALAKGRVPLKRAALARCRRCGRPVAPEAMLSRIRELLREDEGGAPLLTMLTELCVDCRGLASQPAPAGPPLAGGLASGPDP